MSEETPDFLDTAARLLNRQPKPKSDDEKIMEDLDARFGKKDEMAHTQNLQGSGKRTIGRSE